MSKFPSVGVRARMVTKFPRVGAIFGAVPETGAPTYFCGVLPRTLQQALSCPNGPTNRCVDPHACVLTLGPGEEP